MPSNIKVVLFEDTMEAQSAILDAVKKHLASDGAVIAFDGIKESKEDAQRTYEDRVESILKLPPYDDVTLVLADRDLSKSQDFDMRGLSVNSVAAACRRLAIPVASYAREAEPEDGFTWRGRLGEGHIVLRFSEDEDELAREAAVVARGFVAITAKLTSMEIKAGSSPAKILAALLGKLEYSDKIALYAVGDQNRLSDIPRKAQHSEDWKKRLSCFLGYWLWDSLLRYPGVFVNEVAAASYLNISASDFRRPDVQDIFQKALYQGPFTDPKTLQWWRGMLDDIVSSEDCADGLDLVRKRVSSEISPSQCCVDPSKSAGYYCIISRQPVSLENSKGGLSWFPRGADLTRVSKPKFEEYGPWLGA